MQKVNLKILAAVCVFMITFGLTAEADTHYVSPGQSIQAAINAASNGDWIEAAPGTYTEAINFNGKAIRLYSTGGPEVSIIDASGIAGAYHVVQCVSGEDANTILEGFTITGGNANGTEPNDRCGGGMFNWASSPTVIGCVFYNNHTGDGSPGEGEGGNGENSGHGGGMYNYKSSSMVTNCTFSENATGNGGNGASRSIWENTAGGSGGYSGNGAGMYNENSSPTLTKCTFSENATGNGGHGGNSSAFSGCGAGNGGNAGGGAAMYNVRSTPTVINCSFTENTCGRGGNGGLGGSWYAVPWITIGASDGGNGGSGGSGAGLYNYSSSTNISNCSFMRNQTGNGGHGGNGGNVASPSFQAIPGDGGSGGSGGHGGGIRNDSSSPTVTNCYFNSNKNGNGGNGGKGGGGWITIIGDTFGGNGGNGGGGAGIYNKGSSPDVNSCAFFENKAGSGGLAGPKGYTGVWTFISLTGLNGTGGQGGGINSNDASSPVVMNCAFRGNTAWYGGGMGNDYYSRPTITNCTFSGNTAGYGGGMCNQQHSRSTVTNCTFTQNLGKISGGGMYNDSTHSHKIVLYGSWSWVVGNPTRYLDVYIDDELILEGLTIKSSEEHSYFSDGKSWHFDAAPGSEIRTVKRGGKDTSFDYYVIYDGYGNEIARDTTLSGVTVTASDSPLDVSNTIFWNDSPDEIYGPVPDVNYSDIQMSSGTYPGTGNINADPMFADDAGRLSGVSACINVGNNNAPNLPAKDFDGNPRITDATVDMGAFEFTDFRIRNVTADILYASIQPAINDANDGDEICVLPGTYSSSSAIDFKGKAVRLYSTSGPQYTTINGGGAYHVVKCVSGENANTILDGFTITGGDANGPWPDDAGGGMFNGGSSPTVLNCIFIDNSGTYCGGMFNDTSSPIVTNCNFISNSALIGGGMANAYSSSPTVTNCTFSSNHVSYDGAGMFNDTTSPIVTNCTFSGNFADQYGGGIYNRNCSPKIIHCIFGSNQAQYGGGIYNNDNSNPIVTNCNFLYNSASVAGGGMGNYNNSNPIVTNCIFWEDYAPDEISNDSSSPVVTYCDVNIPSGTYPGTGNINANPGFSGAIIAGRPECSNYLSSSASPCVDAGDNNAPNLPDTDMGGQPRVIDGDVDGNSTVDIGAYELQPYVKNVTRNRWYQLIQHSVDDACENDRIEVPPGIYYESVDLMNAPDNFVLTSIDPNDPNIVEQTIIDAKFGGHVIDFWSQGSSCVLAGFTLTVSGNPLMVPGFGYGIGSYGQITSPTIRNCNITNTRGVSFDNGSPVIRGCTIRENYGGIKVLNNAIIEDCIIANNFAIEGQGLYCAVETGWGNTTLRRCVVSGNLSEYTAISCGGNTTLEDCDIFGNTGMMGAVWSSGSPSAGKMSRCTISNNNGGGINGWAGPIENCIITDNVGYRDDLPTWTGGGVNLCTGPISGCVIKGNEAVYGGGLARCSGSIANSVIVANRALLGGGGLSDCDGAISNCTILGNRAWGDPCSPYQGLGGGLYDCNVAIANCIIRQNWAQTAGDQLYSCSDPNYSCIQDWSGGGTGNITADPCFVYAGYWADVNDANIVLEPNEPNAVWVDGFYRLSWASPCIDAGDNNSVAADTADLDGDGNTVEPTPFDFGGLPRFIDDLCTVDTGEPGTLGPPVVDMGAYEFLPADIDNSGSVDLRDFSEFALHWAETGCGRCGGANLTCDGDVDWNDLRVLTDWWLAGTEPEL